MKEFFFKLRISLIRKILGDDIGHLLVCHKDVGDNNHKAILAFNFEEHAPHISYILQNGLIQEEGLKAIIFDAVIEHLSRYEVDCKNFIETLNSKN